MNCLVILTLMATAMAHGGTYFDVVRGIEQQLNVEKSSGGNFWLSYLFDKLFPFGPAGNALLATTYISGPPNLLLAVIPANIELSSLSLLVSFAVGGLLGDVFLHLLPQTFAGQKVDITVNGVGYVIIDEMRGLVLGLGLFIGFFLFFLIDKSLRILQHKEGETSSQTHSHSHSAEKEKENKGGDKAAQSIKTSVYLNLISDFTHNITDGLAIASSFYISKNVGCTTAIATFMHEIPHEVGDFALLIQGGFTKWQAMNCQFITALGAYLGTFIGITLQKQVSSIQNNSNADLWGSGLSLADLTLPFTAGGFLYISFSVIPELLEVDEASSRSQELRKLGGQIIALLVGIGLMVLIALSE